MKKIAKPKKVSLLDQWRNTAALLKASLAETQSKVEYWKGRYDTLNEKFDDIESSIKSEYKQLMRNIEGREIPLFRENQWLRETIELLTIPAEKIGKLEEIRRDRISREDPLNDYKRRY